MTNTSNIKNILLQTQNGDRQSFNLLISTYRDKLLGFVTTRLYNKSDISEAEDILHEIFLKVFLNLKSLKNLEYFDTWLYRITCNTITSYLTKKYKLKHSEFDLNLLAYDEKDNLDLESLPENSRDIAAMIMDGFTYKEIAEKLNCSEGAIKSRVRRLRTI